MITHFLGREEVAAYSHDFAHRLSKQTEFPLLWIARSILRHFDASRVAEIRIAAVSFLRATETVDWSGDATPDPSCCQGPVLIIDSAVHSGRSMLMIVKELSRLGFADIISYSLVLKRGSRIIPTFFGILIDDKDRTYFELDSLPNNRLIEKPPFGILRRISDADVSLTIDHIGAPFVGLTIGDLFYEQETRGFHIYVYEYAGRVIGFVSFRVEQTSLFIDGWGTSEAFKRRGVGSATLRWAETWARANRCEAIELWAFETAVPTYEHYGYAAVEERWWTLGADQRYKKMRRAILYNIQVEPGGSVGYRA